MRESTSTLILILSNSNSAAKKKIQRDLKDCNDQTGKISIQIELYYM